MEKFLVKNTYRGQYVHLKDSENSPIWIRGHYDRSSKTYSFTSYDDSCKEIFRRGNSVVYSEDCKS